MPTRTIRGTVIDLTGGESGVAATEDQVFNVTGTVPAGGAELMTSHEAKHNEVAFAALPASPAVGMVCAVSDSNTATWGATVAAGGSNHILAYYNGTNWTVIGK